MLMDLGMKRTSSCGYMHCTIAASLEMSDEPYFLSLCQSVGEMLACLQKSNKLCVQVAHNQIV